MKNQALTPLMDATTPHQQYITEQNELQTKVIDQFEQDAVSYDRRVRNDHQDQIRSHSRLIGLIVANLTDSLNELMTLEGATCAAIVDYTSGMTLASAGSGIDMELAAAGNTEVMRAKVKTMKSLGLNEQIDDILITLGKQYHVLRPSHKVDGVFIYYVLDKSRANLALARRKISDVESTMTM